MMPFAELVQRAWPLFREAGLQGRTITYGELAGRIGSPVTRRNVHRQLLVPLSVLTEECGLPLLAALVVRKDTGLPGGGFHFAGTGPDPADNWAAAVKRCWEYPWPRVPPAALLERIERTHEIKAASPASRRARRTRRLPPA